MHDLLGAAGPLADDYAAVDWAASPLGPPESWSAAMVGALEVVLHSRYPAALLWGPEFVQVYNAAYVELIGDKHPRALGRPTQECFPEVWPDLGPVMGGVLTGGGAVYVEDSLVPLRRRGFVEDCWFTFCYSPVHHRDGDVEGVVNIAMETTRQVLAARRMQLLARLNGLAADVSSPAELLAEATRLLHGHPDLPWSEVDPDGAWVPDDDPAIVRLPLRRSGAPGLLAVRPDPGLPLDDDYRSFLELVASALGRAWARLDEVLAERERTTRLRGLATTLQQSLLALPGPTPGLDLAVRYRAAARDAQVGGDWYDAFAVGQDLVVSVGDVAGHDQHAVAQMAHLRGLLGGAAHVTRSSPAAVLSALDGAIAGLTPDGIASAVVAQVEASGPVPGRDGGRAVRRANAGHPAPLHLRRDGSVAVVAREPELLLGVDAGAPRSDSLVELGPGEALLLYTDGLVERRGQSLDEGQRWLVDEVARHQGLTLDALCDHLLAAVGDVDDDVALLAVRVPLEA